MKSHATRDNWAALFDSFVSFKPEGDTVDNFCAAGHITCACFTRRVFGIPESTGLQGMADARRQPGGAVISRQLSSASSSEPGAVLLADITSTSEAIDWWVDLMREWEIMPNESPPVIKHPPYVAEALYAKVYTPEILLYGTCQPLRQKDGKAPGSWFRARDAAVERRSLQEFGQKPGAITPEPARRFQLRERPNHSNFAECMDCRDNRLEKERNIKERAPRTTRDATTAKQVAHIVECHAERNVTAEWVREANRSTTLLAELDDKLGSWWNFLPMPPNGRFGKATASKYRYHQCVQANLFPGFGNFFSFVPPFLTTGNNFGCTAFCISLCRLIKAGKLPQSVTHGTRQTDRGPDNDGKTSHGVHYVLVREGTFNDFLWGALRAGHSHNRADATFSEAKAIFYPRTGVGPGCASPMEYHAALADGLKSMPGGLEIMWQLANFDFDKFVSSFMDRDEFTQASRYRLWHYQYAPEIEDVYVRLTFKEKLTDQATDSKAAWRPRLAPNASGWQETDPEGLIFLKTDNRERYVQPNFADPGLEAWCEATKKGANDEGASSDAKPADESGWQCDKVMKDIRETARLEKFKAAQIEEWEALFDFHMRFQSPESLPMAPHTLTAQTAGKSITMHGMPVLWSDMWATLRRLPRTHLNAGNSSQIDSSQPAAVCASTSSAIPKSVALDNDVTGTNHPKRIRDKDAADHGMKVEISKLAPSRSDLTAQELYFIALDNFEGEMAVGMGRTRKLLSSDSKVDRAEVEWLARRGWSADPKHPNFSWAKSPMFDAYKSSNGQIEKSTHPVEDFLPIAVELTDGSTHIKTASLADKRQRFCLSSRCVERLRVFCTQIRPKLIVVQNGDGKKKARQN